MLTQSTLTSRSLLPRRQLLAVLATAGIALTGAAPASAVTLSFTKVEHTYTQQKPDGSGQVATQGATAAGKAS